MASQHFTLFVAFLVAAINYFAPDYYLPETMPQNFPIESISTYYDFIIIGGGSAGKIIFILLCKYFIQEPFKKILT